MVERGRWDFLGAEGGPRVGGPLADRGVMGALGLARASKPLRKLLADFNSLMYRWVMIDWLRYRYQLARLRRTHRKVLAPLSAEYQRAKSEGNIDEAFSPIMEEMDYYHDREAVLQTRYLSNVASKRLIPLPEQPEEFLLGQISSTKNWRRPEHGRMPILTDDAIRELRLALRNDCRERLEIVRSWVVPVLTAALGYLLGLLTHR